MDYWDLRETWDILEWCEVEYARITDLLEDILLDLEMMDD